MSSANDYQVSGNHYQKQAIQAWDFITANKLGYLEGTAVKYISRWRDKNGLEDIRKAIHFLEKLIEVETNEKVHSTRGNGTESDRIGHVKLSSLLGTPESERGYGSPHVALSPSTTTGYAHVKDAGAFPQNSHSSSRGFDSFHGSAALCAQGSVCGGPGRSGNISSIAGLSGDSDTDRLKAVDLQQAFFDFHMKP